MSGLVAMLGIVALFVAYTYSDSANRDVLLTAAIIIAINHAADRISRKDES
jgi:hypothetical protein